MANFVGRPMSRSYGQTDSSGLSHVERDSISNYISHSRDNGQSGQGHKVTLDSEVQSLMRAGVSESTARQLIGNLKSERDNPGVSTLALALPNPGGVGVRPPNLDEIRRNGMEDKMAKRKLSQAQKEALARGRAALQSMREHGREHGRDNITKSNFKKLQERGEAVTLDVPGFYRGVKKKEGPLSYQEVLRRKVAKAKSTATERTIPVGNYVETVDEKGKKRKVRQGNALNPDGTPQMRTIRTAYAKKLEASQPENADKYVVVYKRRESLQPLTEDGERGQGVKKEKSAADNAHINKLIKELKAEIAAFKRPVRASDIKGLSAKETADYVARNEKKLQKIADGTLKRFNLMTERLARLEGSLAAAEGTPIPRAHTFGYEKPSRTPLTDEQKAATKARQAARKARLKEAATLIRVAEDLGKSIETITIKDLSEIKDSPEYQSREIQAEIDALIVKKRALGSRDNGYHMDRDNITLKSGLYGVASFVGGSLAGVVVTNGVHNLASRAGLKSKTADYITKGVGALLAIDLFLSLRDNRGHLFHRIEDRGVRIGLAAGLILPMIARGFVGDMLSKYEFGRKINTFLLPDASAAVSAAAAAAAATPASASGFGSIYDLAFDEVELPTSGVGVDVSEGVAGMGRYVTGAQGVGRYVTGAEGMGRYVTGTSGLGVNVSEALGVNATEALAGQQPSFRTGGTVFRDGLRGLGADEAFDILSELESFDDLSDDDQYMEGIGAVSRGEKAVYASSSDAQKIKSALATAGREVALTFLRPSNVRPNTYIVIVSRPGAETAKQALSQMTQVPSSQPIPPTTLPNAIMTRGVFGKPMFPVTT